MKKSMTESAKRKVAERIGALYRKSLKHMDIMSNTDCIREGTAVFRSEADLVYLVDRALQDCSRDTRFIIRNDYLKVSDPYWYEEFYSRSTYYRLKKEAISEFLESLDI